MLIHLILDAAAIGEILGVFEDNPAGLERLIRLAIETTPKNINLIKAGIEQRDFKSVMDTAHTIKSSCGFLGAHAMAGLCQTLEDRAAANDDSQMASLLADMIAGFEQMKGALMQLIPAENSADR